MVSSKKLSKVKKVQIARHLVQLISFLLLPTLYIETYSSIKAIYIALLRGKFTFEALLPEILILLVVFGTTIILGRFFCGWICGFGSFMDLLYFGSKKIFKTKYKVPEKLDKILKWIKYIILFGSIAFVWSFQSTFLNDKDPWYSFAQFPDFKAMVLNAPIAFGLLIIIIILSMFIERFFCRYLCPLGAAFVLTSRFRLFKISKPSEKCGKCRVCTNNCLMGIDMYKTDVIKDSECIDCFKCVSVCPRKTISMKVEPKATVNPNIVAGVAVSLVVGGSELVNYSNKVKSNNAKYFILESKDQVSTGKYKDGVYSGIANGFKEYNNVQVTIKDGKIAEIKPLDIKDTTDAFHKAFSKIAPEIIAAQSVTNIDVVTGATYSSDAIMKAVENALDQALPDQKVQAKEATIDKNINNTQYRDGIYDGIANGFKDYNNVQVIVKNGKIAEIKPLDIKDTTDAFHKAFSKIAPEIIQTQSTANVDVVTGATYSSDAIIKAVENALNQALPAQEIQPQEKKSEENQKKNNIKSTKYSDGVYEGIANGFKDYNNVQVVITNGKIAEIKPLDIKDTTDAFHKAFSKIAPEIIQTQSTANVDVVTGATYSSDAIVKAVQNALKKAEN
ncbi:MAG: FMN-binding protein [Sarcina sp.]